MGRQYSLMQKDHMRVCGYYTIELVLHSQYCRVEKVFQAVVTFYCGTGYSLGNLIHDGIMNTCQSMCP